MKRLVCILFMMVLVSLMVSTVSADPARFLNSDGNTAYHAEHLLLHLGSKNCKVSGNYIKVRKEPNSKKLVGHLEQADTFSLDAVDGNWAKITVTREGKTSKDSHKGMTGWVDADYVECPCSHDEYYNGPARTVYSIGVATNSNAKLRGEPSKTSTLYAKLKKGDQVEILSEYTGKDKATWYRCRYEGKMGYIRSDMLEITETGLRDSVVEFEMQQADKSSQVNEEQVDKTEKSSLLEPEITSAPVQALTASDESNWQDVYHHFIFDRQYKALYLGNVDGIETYHDSFGNEYYPDTGSEISFGLYDMNKDGVPELFVDNGFYFDGGMKAIYVYTVVDGRLISVGSIADRCGYNTRFFESPDYIGIAASNDNDGLSMVDYYTLTADYRLISELVEELDYNDPNDPENRLVEPLVIGRTNDSNLYDTVKNGRAESVITHSESCLLESDWDNFLYMAEVDRFAYTLRDNDGAEDNLESESDLSSETRNTGSPDGYYEHDDSYQYGQLIGDYIPVKIYADKTVYHAGEPITFQADILGGTPPFSVTWRVEESQTRDDPTPLDQYIDEHDDYVSYTTFATNDRHVEFAFTPPVDSTELFGMFSVVDSKGVGNLSPNEDCIGVASIYEISGDQYDNTNASSSSGMETMSRENWTGYNWDTAMNFRDVLFDSEVYQGDWKDTYLEILRKNEEEIRLHQSHLAENAEYRKGDILKVLFYDLNHDEIPEMLFIKGVSGVEDCDQDDLYVYSNDGSLTKCVLSIPEVFSPVGNGDYYVLFCPFDNSNCFYVQYYDGFGTWQLEYDTVRFTRVNTLRTIVHADEEVFDAGQYWNGNVISEKERLSHWIDLDKDHFNILASTDLHATVSEMSYDEAISFLAGGQDSIEKGNSQNEESKATSINEKNLFSVVTYEDTKGKQYIVRDVYIDSFPDDYVYNSEYWKQFGDYNAKKIVHIGKVGCEPRDIVSFEVKGVIIHICVPKVPEPLRNYAAQNGYSIICVYAENPINTDNEYITTINDIWFYEDYAEINAFHNERTESSKDYWCVGVTGLASLCSDMIVDKHVICDFGDYGIMLYSGWYDSDGHIITELDKYTVYCRNQNIYELMESNSVRIENGVFSMSDEDALWFVEFLKDRNRYYGHPLSDLLNDPDFPNV